MSTLLLPRRKCAESHACTYDLTLWGHAESRQLRSNSVRTMSDHIAASMADMQESLSILGSKSLAIFSMTRILNGVSGRVSPERVMTLRWGRDVQSAYIIESAKHDLHLSLERPIPAGETVEFSVSTGFPVETKVVTGAVHWSMSHRVNSEIGVAVTAPVPPELIVASRGSLRNDIRYPCKVAGMLGLVQDKMLKPATAINYSRSGMCLQSTERFEAGQELRFEWNSWGGRTESASGREMTASIRWISHVGGMSLIGCDTPEKALWPLASVDIVKLLQSPTAGRTNTLRSGKAF
jgi:hypothetical protein